MLRAMQCRPNAPMNGPFKKAVALGPSAVGWIPEIILMRKTKAEPKNNALCNYPGSDFLRAVGLPQPPGSPNKTASSKSCSRPLRGRGAYL